MQVSTKKLSETQIELSLSGDEATLSDIKRSVLEQLNRTQVKVQGFRQGKAPLGLVEKNANQSALQTEFLDRAVNFMYGKAIQQEKLRPVSRPDVAIKKFVPYSTLEVTATFDVIGDVKLPDYVKTKLDKPAVKITDKDIDEVMDALRTRGADKAEIDGPAAKDTEVILDFKGTDAKTKEPIAGADGKAYPLIIGSDSFIPGFEDNLIGMKAGDSKDFDITFPKDYSVSALQDRAVTFSVTVHKVQSITRPELDDAFASKVGAFKTVDELKADVRTQLASERQSEADRQYESDLLEKLTDEATITVPASMVDDELNRMEQEERQNLVYRGQTWEEHLKQEGVSEAEHHEQKRPSAERRVKAGLVLAEIAEREKIDISEEELNLRLQLLKGQYQDKSMQAELDKPENKREIAARMVTEKTIAKLVDYASA